MRTLKTTIVRSVAVLALLLLSSCANVDKKSASPPAAAPASTPPAPTAGGTTSNCLAPPFLVASDSGKQPYDVPKDMALTRQADANCFAWQEFIALNWAASSAMRGQPDKNVPASQFGDPNDQQPTVWETYKESDEVFLADAKDPARGILGLPAQA